ncbi:MAG TPA: hypothetical protein PLJ35_05130, partial [Anaerolineae bacterium]|nr:hypothetical protein [Anaerolineae bacterium]
MARTDAQLKQLLQDNLSEDGTELDLSGQGLDDDDLLRLVPMLARLTGLLWLSLSHNSIGDAGAAGLAQGNLTG